MQQLLTQNAMLKQNHIIFTFSARARGNTYLFHICFIFIAHVWYVYVGRAHLFHIYFTFISYLFHIFGMCTGTRTFISHIVFLRLRVVFTFSLTSMYSCLVVGNFLQHKPATFARCLHAPTKRRRHQDMQLGVHG